MRNDRELKPIIRIRFVLRLPEFSAYKFIEQKVLEQRMNIFLFKYYVVQKFKYSPHFVVDLIESS